MFLKSILYAALAIGSATMGQRLIIATQRFIAGEKAIAHIDPYASAAQQDQQIAAAMGTIQSVRGAAQQAPQS